MDVSQITGTEERGKGQVQRAGTKGRDIRQVWWVVREDKGIRHVRWANSEGMSRGEEGRCRGQGQKAVTGAGIESR